MLILRGPDNTVASLAFAPDAATLYAVHESKGVHAWSLADRSVAPLDVEGLRVQGEFVAHPGGRWAFGRRPSGGFPPRNDACLLDLKAGRSRPFNFIGSVGQHVAISPDGARVVTVGHSDLDKERPAKARSDRVYSWKMTATGPRYEWHLDTPPDAQPWRVVFAGDSLVSEDWIPEPPLVTIGFQHTQPRLAARSASSGEVLRTLDSPTRRVEQLLASPDGTEVVVRGGTQLWVYDATDWAKPPVAVAGKHWNRHQERAAAFHPSGDYLLLANNGPSVIAYDATTWKQAKKWNWKAGTLRSVAVSADGALAAAGSARGAVVVWDLDL